MHMIYAVYKQNSAGHGWALVCPCSSKEVAEAVSADIKAYAVSQGFTEAETGIVEKESLAEVEASVWKIA